MQLHVSFGAVGNCCHSALRTSFYRISLHELKNCSFPQTKRFPFTKSFALCSQKPLVFATQTPLIRTTFYCPQKPPIFTNQKIIFCTNLFYCHPKQLFSTLRRPFQRPLTYCFQRMRLFFCCSLNSLRCKVRASHRFKSLPAIPEKLQFSALPVT